MIDDNFNGKPPPKKNYTTQKNRKKRKVLICPFVVTRAQQALQRLPTPPPLCFYWSLPYDKKNQVLSYHCRHCSNFLSVPTIPPVSNSLFLKAKTPCFTNHCSPCSNFPTDTTLPHSLEHHIPSVPDSKNTYLYHYRL